MTKSEILDVLVSANIEPTVTFLNILFTVRDVDFDIRPSADGWVLFIGDSDVSPRLPFRVFLV